MSIFNIQAYIWLKKCEENREWISGTRFIPLQNHENENSDQKIYQYHISNYIKMILNIIYMIISIEKRYSCYNIFKKYMIWER